LDLGQAILTPKGPLTLQGTIGVWVASLDVIPKKELKLFVNMRFGISFAGVQFL
jgi:hypothetical protein